MKTRFLALAAALTLAGPALAEGDAAKGESDFKKCKACHMIVADDGTEIQKGGKTGPNLYGVIGRAVGSADFKYGDALVAIGEGGLVWDEAELAAWKHRIAGAWPGVSARLAQPMPETIAVFLRSSSQVSMARIRPFITMPWPQPGHQIWGSLPGRIDFS